MKERKEKKKWGLIVFIVFIMLGTTFSFVFYGLSPPADVVNYNGIKFSGDGTKWTAKIKSQYAAFSFLPADVQSINSSAGLPVLLQEKLEIDTTSDFNDTFRESIALAEHQMGLTYAAYGVYLRSGFTANNTYNIPIITCKDSTVNVPVIYFREGNSTRIYVEDSCIIAEGSEDLDFIRMKDKMMYLALGVLK